MAVEYDTRSLSPLQAFLSVNSFQLEWSHSASGNNRCAVVGVLCLRTDPEEEDIVISAYYNGVAMTLVERVWLGDDDGTPGTILAVFALRNIPSGSRTVQVFGVCAGNMGIRVRAACLSYRNVSEIGSHFTNTGSESGTAMTVGIESYPGSRVVYTGGADQYTAIDDFNQSARQVIDLESNSVRGEGLMGDAAGGILTPFYATRIGGRNYGQIVLDLLPAPQRAKLRLTRSTPTIAGPVVVRPAAARLILKGRLPGTPLLLPAPATVLTLNGLNYNINDYVQNFFNGYFNSPPYTRYKVDYPASLAIDSIEPTGVANLDKALRDIPGKKIVVAHSQGAQVCSRWMRKYRDDPTAPTAQEVVFVLVGNPLRHHTGYIIGRTEVGGEVGLPTPLDTPWPIIDVARRYDGWADWPGDDADPVALQNASSGKALRHPNDAYAAIDLFDSRHTIWEEGNTTFVLTYEEERPPFLKSWILLGEQGLAVALAYKRHIEKAHSRPINDPPVVVDPAPNVYWAFFLARLGIDYS